MMRETHMRFNRGFASLLALVLICSVGLNSWAQNQTPAPAGSAQPAVSSAPTQQSPASQPSATPSPAGNQAAGANQSASAQEAAIFRPRLPMYYAKVVDEKQRQKIYDIQRKYHPQIAALQKQLEQLIAQRDAEIEAVLTPQQKAEIEKLRQEAAQRRKEKTQADDGPQTNTSSQQ